MHEEGGHQRRGGVLWSLPPTPEEKSNITLQWNKYVVQIFNDSSNYDFSLYLVYNINISVQTHVNCWTIIIRRANKPLDGNPRRSSTRQCPAGSRQFPWLGSNDVVSPPNRRRRIAVPPRSIGASNLRVCPLCKEFYMRLDFVQCLIKKYVMGSHSRQSF